VGEVVNVNFGAEREWEQTHRQTIDAMIRIGRLFGDDETLMRAKADCVYYTLRQMIEEMPSMQLKMKLPEDLPPAQAEYLIQVIKDAALRGIDSTHAFSSILDGIHL
jgi:hypothetical protein